MREKRKEKFFGVLSTESLNKDGGLFSFFFGFFLRSRGFSSNYIYEKTLRETLDVFFAFCALKTLERAFVCAPPPSALFFLWTRTLHLCTNCTHSNLSISLSLAVPRSRASERERKKEKKSEKVVSQKWCRREEKDGSDCWNSRGVFGPQRDDPERDAFTSGGHPRKSKMSSKTLKRDATTFTFCEERERLSEEGGDER